MNLEKLERILAEAYDALSRERDLDTAMACLHEAQKMVADRIALKGVAVDHFGDVETDIDQMYEYFKKEAK